MLSDQQFTDLAGQMETSGGFSVNPRTGASITNAYLVGGYAPGYQGPSAETTGATIKGYAKASTGALAGVPKGGTETALGGWRNRPSDYFDVSTIHARTPAGLRSARAATMHRKEQAFGEVGHRGEYAGETANPFHAANVKPDRAVGLRAQKFWMGTGVAKRYPGLSRGVGVGRDL